MVAISSLRKTTCNVRDAMSTMLLSGTAYVTLVLDITRIYQVDI